MDKSHAEPLRSWSEVPPGVAVAVFGHFVIVNHRPDLGVYAFTKEEIEAAAKKIHADLSQLEWVRPVNEIE